MGAGAASALRVCGNGGCRSRSLSARAAGAVGGNQSSGRFFLSWSWMLRARRLGTGTPVSACVRQVRQDEAWRRAGRG